MKSNLYIAIIKKAAQEYFREGDAPLVWLNARQHRILVDAVHETYSRITDERERDFIEAVYRDDVHIFIDAVKFHAKLCGGKEKWAWMVLDRFALDVMNRAGLLNNGKPFAK